MKKLLLSISILALLASCKPAKEAKTEVFELPAVEDIAMYQVNPRVFAPENSLNAVAARIDSIRELGVNMMWVMPIYPIGIPSDQPARWLAVGAAMAIQENGPAALDYFAMLRGWTLCRQDC